MTEEAPPYSSDDEKIYVCFIFKSPNESPDTPVAYKLGLKLEI